MPTRPRTLLPTIFARRSASALARAWSLAIVLPSLLLAAPCSAGQPTIIINEFFYQDPGSDDWIEYKNVGQTTIDVSEYWQCTGPICLQLQVVGLLAGDDRVMEPGEIIVLDTAFFASSTAGELALRDEEFNVIDFMQYGSSQEFNYSQQAVDLGLWLDLGPNSYDFVPRSAPDESATLCTSIRETLTTSLDFVNKQPTQGTDNLCGLFFSDGFETGDITMWSSSANVIE